PAAAAGALVVALGALAASGYPRHAPSATPALAPAATERFAIDLFNGQNLSGWRGTTGDGNASVVPTEVAIVEGTELVFSAQKLRGGIGTVLGYHDYDLAFEYLFPEEGTLPDFPACIMFSPEASWANRLEGFGEQLRPGSAGDL